MKRFVLLLVVLLSTAQTFSQQTQQKKSSLQKFLNVFSPKPTPKPVRKKPKVTKKEVKVSPTPSKQRTKTGLFIVDAQWLANYREQEMAWSYSIPEDDEIKFENGKYHVSPVVYRHYEDMLKTSRIDDQSFIIAIGYTSTTKYTKWCCYTKNR